MCLVVLGIECHPRYRLVIAANRDENYVRPTAVARFWNDCPEILAGRDMEAGGTWLGITRTGRIAALTNYYGPNEYERDKLSRGRLIPDFLAADLTREEYLQFLRYTGDRYNGFSLVFGDSTGLSYYSNRGEPVAGIGEGIYGLSNHLLDTPWPKVNAAKAGLRRAVERDDIDPEELFEIFADPTRYPDNVLPDTGVGIQRERSLSSVFVTLPEFGTRCSTVILVDRENRMTFMERSFDDRRQRTGCVTFSIEP